MASPSSSGHGTESPVSATAATTAPGNCAHEFIRLPKRDFLGFHRSVCPHCGKKRTEPLTPSYRVFLYLLTALFWALATTGAPGVVLALYGTYAVVKDLVLLLIRRRSARAIV